MNINDETLSAFLDSELNEHEMEQVRKALETDDELVMRLAELSEVDMRVKEHATSIDEVPLSDSLAKTVAKLDTPTSKSTLSSNVVTLTPWQKVKQSANKSLAIAASVAVVFGIAMMSYLQPNESQNLVASNTALALDTQLSSGVFEQSNGSVFRAQLSFKNQQGELCRQYALSSNNTTQTSIACKTQNGWQIKAQTATQQSNNGAQYQTASNNNELDAVIDSMISGAPLDRAQEQQAINAKWQLNK
ncbi:hypothetical protein [uncultured Pseudoalteromonas sp.]|uniref:hypothetical protein n=1 Tax=uncultured Pseudoalteromonas sp. TaxID=114053 RepID=UPI0030C7ADFA